MAFLPDGESLAVAFQHGGAPKFGAGQAGTSLALAVVPMADALVDEDTRSRLRQCDLGREGDRRSASTEAIVRHHHSRVLDCVLLEIKAHAKVSQDGVFVLCSDVR